MAQWKQTLEPYIRVQERVMSATLNPTAGEDLIIGVALISDAGPSVPTLITSQSEFLKTYASKDLSQEYLESLNNLYSGSDKTVAATMWANAYRLAGSNTLLAVRASKATDIFFAKPLVKGDLNTYILRDGELLKKVDSFKLVLDIDKDDANHDQDGWAIAINGVGVFGNRTTDEGAQYDYYVDSLPELVEKLNETSKFFSPSYKFYSDALGENEVTDIESVEGKSSVIAVIFDEVYLGSSIIDKTDPRTKISEIYPNGHSHTSAETYTAEEANAYNATLPGAISTEDIKEEAVPYSGYVEYNEVNSTTLTEEEYNALSDEAKIKTPAVYYTEQEVNTYNADLTGAVKEGDSKVTITNLTLFDGLAYIISCETDWTLANPDQKVIDLNGSGWSGFTQADYYAINVFNSATTLKVRIRRFNHDAVASKELADSQTSSLTENGQSPYTVLTNVLDTFTAKGTKVPSESILARDFYEVAVWDPSVNDKVSFFNIGSILGRGDIDISELNSLISMIQVNLPDNLLDLGINYYGYDDDDYIWENIGTEYDGDDSEDVEDFPENPTEGKVVKKGTTYYKYVVNGNTQIFADLTIDPLKYKILSVSDTDLKKALDLIALDEVYVTEGLCDLGNTELGYQNYMANMAINDNYFYPISTVNSTNYMTIGNSATKISQNSYKLYMSAPWDIDTGNLGWKFYASPSVLYWESVARNRRNNEEFRGIFGQVGGIMQYQRPVTEFNKKTRQLLLSKRVNTVLWNTQTQAWNMNDNYTKQNEDTIMSDEGNSRLMIRISKAIPVILRQFIGRKISDVLCNDVKNTINYFFSSVILPMVYSVDAYQVFCDFDEILARQNKIKVVVNVRYSRSLKYIEVYNRAFDVGMDISSSEA